MRYYIELFTVGSFFQAAIYTLNFIEVYRTPYYYESGPAWLDAYAKCESNKWECC